MLLQSGGLGVQLLAGRCAFLSRGGVGLDGGVDLFQSGMKLLQGGKLIGEGVQHLGGGLNRLAGSGGGVPKQIGGVSGQLFAGSRKTMAKDTSGTRCSWMESGTMLIPHGRTPMGTGMPSSCEAMRPSSVMDMKSIRSIRTAGTELKIHEKKEAVSASFFHGQIQQIRGCGLFFLFLVLCRFVQWCFGRCPAGIPHGPHRGWFGADRRSGLSFRRKWRWWWKQKWREA